MSKAKVRHRFFSVAIAMALVLLTGCEIRAPTVFSTRTSPDGSRVVENGYDGDGEGGGRIVLRSKDGSQNVYRYADTAPDAFMRWRDDRSLEIWRDGQMGASAAGPDRLGDVEVINRTYVPPRDIAAAFANPTMPVKKIDVQPGDVAATFARYVKGDIRHCVLTLATTPSAGSEPVKVEIDAEVNPTCGRRRPCSSIETRFKQGRGQREGRQTMLTSATISDIASYNRLATGDNGTSLRGQFLEENATKLVEDLQGSSIVLEFSLDFFERVVKYVLHLTAVAKQTKEFSACVGDADMSSIRH